MSTKPRIILIHALQQSQGPTLQAFAEAWPEAETFNLMDDSLSADLAAGADATQIQERFLTLSRYAAASGTAQRPTAGILFTCSAFGPAIEHAQRQLDLPVLKPNEAAFEAALVVGSRIGLMVTFAAALAPLANELQAMAQRQGRTIDIVPVVADGALAALQRGDGAQHDALAAQAAEQIPSVDVLVLCQFSLARAYSAVERACGYHVITTPQSAVKKLRHMIERPDA
ncbi:MAG: aspartate/glutamate racemase family protein [Pusillimonas sp.]